MGLIENFKDLFKKEVPADQMTEIFSRLDVDQFFSLMNNYWNPSELIRKIGGLENLEKLYKDSEIFAAVDKRLAALLDTKLVLEGGTPENLKFFNDQILPHERALKQYIWWAVPYGYSVIQILYNPDLSGRVDGFKTEEFYKFEPLPDLIHVRLIDTSVSHLRNQVMPYGKWVLTTNGGTYAKPEGDPMFERLIMPWIFRCNGWDLWMDFAKRFANGFMHAKIADMEKKDEVRKALEKAAKSAIIVTDKDSDLTVLQASRDSTIYESIDRKTVESIQRVVLGETLSSMMSERGSSGAASVQNLVREEKSKADVALIVSSINNIIEQIGAVNGMAPESLPKATIIYDPGINQELATRDQSLYQTGVRFTKEYYQNKYGLKDTEFDIAEETSSSGFPFSIRRKRTSPSQKSTFLAPNDIKNFLGGDAVECETCRKVELAPNLTRKDNKQIEEKEDVVSYLRRNGEHPISMDDVIAAIKTSKNQKDLDLNLSALFDQRNNGFVDDLTDALYYAATKGALLGNPKTLKPEGEDE